MLTSAAVQAQNEVDLAALSGAVSQQSAQEAERAMQVPLAVYREALLLGLGDRLLDELVFVADDSLRAVARSPVTARLAKVGVSFTRANPRAVAWARQHAGETVADATAKTRAAINQVIQRAFAEQLTPQQTARLLRSTIGLTEGEAKAVANLRRAMRENPGKVVSAGGTRIRVPKGGASKEFLTKRSERYASTLLNRRAERIARTEINAASNEGLRQSWLEAMDEELLPSAARREWVYTQGRVFCQVCGPMDGQKRRMDQPFVTGDGRRVLSPPAHPNCRCGQGLAAGR